jgi:glycosyltransferase involved in cell wall biosynthesis
MRDLELIIIDDCSTDASLDILQFYAEHDKRVKWISTPHNMGQARATNLGAELATGDYFAWHHSDDNYHPDFLNRLLATKADVAYSAYAFLGKDGKEGRVPYDLATLKYDFQKLKNNCYLCCGAMIYKREIFEKLGGYDVSFETSCDWDFSIRACELAGDVAVVPEVLFYYRDWHTHSNRYRISEKVRKDNRKRIADKHGL